MKKVILAVSAVFLVASVVVLYFIGAKVHRDTGLTEDQVQLFHQKT